MDPTHMYLDGMITAECPSCEDTVEVGERCSCGEVTVGEGRP